MDNVCAGVRMSRDQQLETTVTHRFGAGQKVRFSKSFPYRNAAAGDYEVVRQLPSRNGEFQYRIKSVREPHERVAGENELERA